MSLITGIGGVFLQFKGDKEAVHNWYERVFNMDMTLYGTGFIEGDQLALVSFKRDNNELTPQINFRVNNIEHCLVKVKKHNGQIISQIQEYDYGKFAQFVDPFGNSVELWEPYKEEYRSMVQKEINEYKKNKSTE